MNEKQLLALAAIGAAVWYFTKKGGAASAAAAATKPAIAPAAGSGGIWDGFGVGGPPMTNAMGQVPAVNIKAPPKVPERSNPMPSGGPVESVGGAGVGSNDSRSTVSATGYRTYWDGSGHQMGAAEFANYKAKGWPIT